MTMRQAAESLDADTYVDVLTKQLSKKLREKGIVLDEGFVITSHETAFPEGSAIKVEPIELVFEEIGPARRGAR